MSCRDIATLARHIIQRLPAILSLRCGKDLQIQQYRAGEPQSAGAARHRRRAEDRAHRGRRLRPGGQHPARHRRVILVLNGMASMRERAEEGERLMDWAFASFEDVTLFTADDAVEHAPVWLGATHTVPLVGGRDLVLTMPRNWRQTAKMKLSYQTPIPAPVAKGTEVGKLSVVRRKGCRPRNGAGGRRGRAPAGRGRARAAVLAHMVGGRGVKGRFITLEGGEGAGKSTQAGCWRKR